MRILFLTENKQDATSFYRGAGIVSDLSKKLKSVIDILNWDEVVLGWNHFAQYDLIYMQRPLTKSAVEAATYLKIMGKKIWIDWDDDYINIPTWHFFVLQLQSYIENIKTLAGLADIITVTTKSLYDVYIAFNSNVHIIPNAIPEVLFTKTVNNNSGGVFWRGSHLHFPNLMNYVNEIQKCTEISQIKFMGLNPYFLTSYKLIAEMDVYNYFNHYKNLSPKFTFVTLIDHPFNRGRSNIAWIEATMAGAVCLAPDWEEWQMPGIIRYSSREDFVYSYGEMVKEDLSHFYKISYEYIRQNLILEKVNKLRVELV